MSGHASAAADALAWAFAPCPPLWAALALWASLLGLRALPDW